MQVDQVIDKVIARFIGSKHERDIKRMTPVVAAINALEPEVKSLSDVQLRERMAELKAEVQQRLEGVERDDPAYRLRLADALEPALAQTFALTREAGRRHLNMRHFDVQLIGGMVLHAGKIAEMKTGEGKTLVATLPVYLNALSGRGVHVVTVNDYLAQRDANWMGQIYRFLGLSVGCIIHGLSDEQRR